MKSEIKAGNRFWTIFVLGVLFCAMLFGKTGMAAESENENESENQNFTIDAHLLPFSWDNGTFDIQVIVGNQGEDWEGTVRMCLNYSYKTPRCAYDTALSLPQGSTKQFVLKIPIEVVDDRDGTVNISLLDKKSNMAAQKDFERLLLEGADTLSMGILSDSYSSLTYLDMGGEEIYYGRNNLPIKLLELNQDNLTDSLDSLIYLVIDNYNTRILTDKTLDRIKQWVHDGGALIVGTGSRAQEVLSGLDYLGVECEKDAYSKEMSQLSLAELKDTNGRYETDSYTDIMVTSWGDGMVEIVPYALSDLGKPDLAVQDWETYVWMLLTNVNNYAHIQNAYASPGAYYENHYILRWFLRVFGSGSSSLNFSALKWIVTVYVIFVGPVLYLILRRMKKQDFYWIAVPITTLVGIFVVYLAGRGFEVANTRVYSVTVENLSDQSDQDAVTYLYCYDARHEEWMLRLSERYAYIGPIFKDYYVNNDSKYQYHVYREGDMISFGLNPNTSFENCYYKAQTREKQGVGSISSDIKFDDENLTGTVTNGTNRDFQYFAVMIDSDLYVYGGLQAGETCSLERETVMETYLNGYIDDYTRSQDNDREKTNIDSIAALGMGIYTACPVGESDEVIIIGVTTDWDKAVDDNCSETAYGCLYSVQ